MSRNARNALVALGILTPVLVLGLAAAAGAAEPAPKTPKRPKRPLPPSEPSEPEPEPEPDPEPEPEPEPEGPELGPVDDDDDVDIGPEDDDLEDEPEPEPEPSLGPWPFRHGLFSDLGYWEGPTNVGPSGKTVAVIRAFQEDVEAARNVLVGQSSQADVISQQYGAVANDGAWGPETAAWVAFARDNYPLFYQAVGSATGSPPSPPAGAFS